MYGAFKEWVGNRFGHPETTVSSSQNAFWADAGEVEKPAVDTAQTVSQATGNVKPNLWHVLSFCRTSV